MAESIKPGEEKAARESVNFIHSIIEKIWRIISMTDR